jgi:ribosome biogenesis GTPase
MPASPGDWADWDESDVRVRPNPKANRPRTKRRPAHADARPGMVTTVDRGRYRVRLDGAGPTVTAARARELHRERIVVGDRVDLVGDLTGAAGTLARIVRVEPRRTVLRRSADDADQVERVVVANADTLLIVVAAASPDPSLGFIDRCVVAALDAGIDPVVVVTKTDLAAAAPVRAHLSGLDVPVIESAGGSAAAPVRDLARGRVVALVGHSGVGKSTLLNAVAPDAERSTGHVNAVTGRGRHTSSSALAVPVDDGGWLVDTPGVRSFGLGHVRPERVLAAFPDLEAIVPDVLRTPLGDLDAEALAARVPEGRRARVRSLVRMLRGLAGEAR